MSSLSARLPALVQAHRSTARLVVAAMLVSSLATAAHAQSTPTPSPAAGRYTMHPADGGMLRLDGDTGTVSMCKSKDGQWQCESLPDERAALDKEISRLTKENQDLQSAVKRLEELAGLPSDKPNEKRADKGFGGSLPSPEDVDKAMTYLQSMLKKFKEKLKDFENLEGRKTERL